MEDSCQGGIAQMEDMHIGMPYIFYQLELSMLVLDCFLMYFQSGVVFCNSQVIGALPCQEIENWTLEFEFRVYHSI